MIQKLVQHKTKIILIQLALFQVFFSFITNFLVVKEIGFGSEIDVYYIAMAVFAFLFTSIGWSISSVLTPILIENREKNLEGAMFINIVLITVPIFLISIGSMFLWSKLIFINYMDIIEYDKIVKVQAIFLVTFLFSTVNIVFLSILQEKDQYIKINFLNMCSAIFGLIFVYTTIEQYGIYSAVFSQLGMQIFLFIIMFTLTFSTLKTNFRFDKDKMKLLWHRMKYIFFGSFYYRTDELIERFIASYLTPGFLSLIGFVQRIYGAIISVLNSAIAGPTITKFSNLIKENKYKEVKKTLYNYLLLLFIIDLFIFIGVLLFGEYLFLYFFGDKIDEQLVPMVYNAILFLFAMVFGKTLGQVLQSLLLSLKLEKEATQYEVFTFTLGIILKIGLTVLHGMMGLLIAIVIGELIKNIVKYSLIQKKGFKNGI
jgi:O-antigen/teichoic acid export membrane protein